MNFVYYRDTLPESGGSSQETEDRSHRRPEDSLQNRDDRTNRLVEDEQLKEELRVVREEKRLIEENRRRLDPDSSRGYDRNNRHSADREERYSRQSADRDDRHSRQSEDRYRRHDDTKELDRSQDKHKSSDGSLASSRSNDRHKEERKIESPRKMQEDEKHPGPADLSVDDVSDLRDLLKNRKKGSPKAAPLEGNRESPRRQREDNRSPPRGKNSPYRSSPLRGRDSPVVTLDDNDRMMIKDALRNTPDRSGRRRDGGRDSIERRPLRDRYEDDRSNRSSQSRDIYVDRITGQRKSRSSERVSIIRDERSPPRINRNKSRSMSKEETIRSRTHSGESRAGLYDDMDIREDEGVRGDRGEPTHQQRRDIFTTQRQESRVSLYSGNF